MSEVIYMNLAIIKVQAGIDGEDGEGGASTPTPAGGPARAIISHNTEPVCLPRTSGRRSSSASGPAVHRQ